MYGDRHRFLPVCRKTATVFCVYSALCHLFLRVIPGGCPAVFPYQFEADIDCVQNFQMLKDAIFNLMPNFIEQL